MSDITTCINLVFTLVFSFLEHGIGKPLNIPPQPPKRHEQDTKLIIP
jgi:hypothetical protein